MVGNERTNQSATAARLVRAARGKRGMSQRDLAVAAGVPQSTVAMVEAGRRQPSVLMLERLLDAAGFRLETNLVNTIAHDNWTVDDDVVWAAVDQYAPELHRALTKEIEAARALLQAGEQHSGTSGH